jgi:hypothetical protein
MGSKEILIFGTLGVAAITIIAVAGTGGDPIQPTLVGTATVTTGAP